MRKFPFASAVLVALVGAISSGSAFAQTVVPPPGKANSLVSGAYFLLLAPKKLGGQEIRAQRPGVLPITIKTDGKSIVVGGPAVQMTGTIRDGSMSLTHAPGTSLVLTGNTFNGYAASGTFRGGAPGNFEGTFALATVSRGGYKFLTQGAGAGINLGRAGGGSNLGAYAAPGSGSWGYEGPGLNIGGNGRSDSAFAQPGFGYAADGKDGKDSKGNKSWSSGLDITGGTPSGGSSGSSGGGDQPGTKKQAKENFDKSGTGAQAAPSVATNDGGFVDAVKCAFIACSPAPGEGGGDTGTAPIKPKFDAGDWEPMGGDTSPGQKPNTGNGQDKGGGSSTAGSALHRPGTGGDPSDFFKPQGGDVLNTNRLFNGASDPPRGAGGNFIR